VAQQSLSEQGWKQNNKNKTKQTAFKTAQQQRTILNHNQPVITVFPSVHLAMAYGRK